MRKQFDYSLCEQERLAHSAHIQGVGVLCLVDEQDKVSYISDNTGLIGHSPAKDWLASPASEYLLPIEYDYLLQCRSSTDNRRSSSVLPDARESDGLTYEMAVQKIAQGWLLEWMPQTAFRPAPDIHFPAQLKPSDSYETVMDYVESIEEFDRVLLYRFEDDGCGTVVAERNIGCPFSVLGLRYPSTDIPQIARQLFYQQPVRLIWDADAPAVPVLSDTQSDAPLDLSQATLRSVSPYHIEYLKNLGINTSCSAAIFLGEQLWGLLTVQYVKARALSFHTCRSLNRVTQAFGNYLSQYDIGLRLNLQKKFSPLLNAFFKTQHSENEFKSVVDFLYEHTECSGVAIYQHQHWSVDGITPETSTLKRLSRAFFRGGSKGIFHTDCFDTGLYRLTDFDKTLCGVAAAWYRYGTARSDILACFLFKEEAINMVTWGSQQSTESKVFEQIPSGENTKNTDKTTFGPKTSFGRWEKQLAGHSLPWPACTGPILRLMQLRLLASVMREKQ